MAPQQKSQLNIVMGAMTFGEARAEQARVHDLEDVKKILDVFQAHGHTEVDTARVYCDGTSEEYLGKIDWQGRGLQMETKLYPTASSEALQKHFGMRISHSPEDLRKYLKISLKALNADKIDMFYLHGPDRTTPYDVTLKAINDLHKEGYFSTFGISNYTAWEVAEMVTICRERGYIQPTVYQGLYNAIHRAVEPELFPCLRKYGISFYAFNPLGGGLLTGRYNTIGEDAEAGSRFDSNRIQGQLYKKRYWHEHYFKAIQIIKEASEKAGLTMAEVALRWISHHSLLKREFGDAVLIGASSLKHIEQNLTDFEKGPLPKEVVEALDQAWATVKALASPYHH
ncbi:Aldo keto reductase [Pyrrhoderma noxium]|uniref:Aldo keto reductase n=1 Tax=Pyrrhoderma noxium TaxID=2282107 RepID=A0A286UHW4_9AGAM|nr:Aldo keto reductase [Pyrrhoderma noxium]